MTKHQSSFTERQRPDVPDSQALVSFVHQVGFIIATERTKAQLDGLVKMGVLKRRKQGKLWRYTPAK